MGVYLFRRGVYQFCGKKHPHSAASIVPSLDCGAVKVVLQGFLFSGAGADVDKHSRGAGSLVNRSPCIIDGGLEFCGIKPTSRDTSLHGETNHARAGVLGVAGAFINDLAPAAGALILVWPECAEMEAELVKQFISCGMVGWPVAEHECEPEGRETIAAAPCGFAQG
ncbi:MAG: hypothetical protein RLZZ458_3653 [Planctomycetota bacterium]|jgi:hypothetical protein